MNIKICIQHVRTSEYFDHNQCNLNCGLENLFQS